MTPHLPFSLLSFLISMASSLILASAAMAQSPGSYPEKPIRVIVPFPAGGSVDVTTRQLAQKLSQQLGQAIIVENRAGAGGNIGMDALAKSAPDGYTLGIGALSTHAVNPSLYPKLAFDPVRDFAPISLLVVTPNVLVINPAVLPAKDIQGIIDFARKNPGKVNCASGSNGSAGHLACELFRLTTGAPIAHIPYKGAAPAVTDLLGGQVQMMFDNLANAMPHIKSGKTLAFAVTTPKRSMLSPELPTMGEAGFKDFDIYTWWGLFAPAGTPREIITRLNSEVGKALASQDLRSQWLAGGAEPSPTSPEGLASFIARELPKYARIVKDSAAKLD